MKKNQNKTKYFIFAIFIPLFFLTLGFIFKQSERHRKAIDLTNEQELKVNIQAGFGKISIERCVSAMILQADINAELKYDIEKYLDYSIRDKTGYLNINTTETIKKGSKKKEHSFHLGELQDNDWNMQFTDVLPISFDIELGMGKGNLDMTGLKIKDLNLSTGASSVVLRFDEPNKYSIENLTIESGLSKFKAYGLSNANFQHMKFEGGVGSYLLDFGGDLEKEVDVDLQMGLGSITISIPDDIGVKIFYEKSFMASIDFPKDIKEKEEDSYYSSNYHQANGRINMHIEAGLGSVRIKRE